MTRMKVAKALAGMAKKLVGGDVPESFKKNWDKGEEKEAKEMMARELVLLARELAGASPFKEKVPLEEVKRDMEHRSVRALNAALSLGPRAKLVKDDFLVFSEGSSHKFHLFSLYQESDGTWKAGNAYGRIGGEPKAIQIAVGTEPSVRAEYARKLRSKLAKGYETV